MTQWALPPASDTAAGYLTTGAQTIAGVKTFTANPIVQVASGSGTITAKSSSGGGILLTDRSSAGAGSSAVVFTTAGNAKGAIGLDNDGTDNLHIGPDSSFTSKWVTFTQATGAMAVNTAATLGSTLGVTGAATLSSTLGVTGVATFSDRVDAASTVRATGAGTPASGAGVEVDYGAVANTGRVFAYDRTGAAYRALNLLGSTVDIRPSNTSSLLVAASAVTAGVPIGLKSYTVATLPTATATHLIYVSDEVGGATPAFADGTNFRRTSDRAIVS